ncbi:helix-turn-helix domain-containing protein [Corynebacterium lowii]|nr:helix-turn-helix domain-containing protein [Corynebacterium lowii]MDP9851695.1 AcrR family transcriptional regulator [Corynebacterium lowii]
MSNNPRRMGSADRSEQIVRVAAEHFARHGIAGASLSAIARDAGVTRALVYHYFAGKEALLEAVLRR